MAAGLPSAILVEAAKGAGKLDERMVEIEVKERGPQFEILSNAGMEEMDVNLREMLSNLMPRRTKRRKVKIPEALEILAQRPGEARPLAGGRLLVDAQAGRIDEDLRESALPQLALDLPRPPDDLTFLQQAHGATFSNQPSARRLAFPRTSRGRGRRWQDRRRCRHPGADSRSIPARGMRDTGTATAQGR